MTQNCVKAGTEERGNMREQKEHWIGSQQSQVQVQMLSFSEPLFPNVCHQNWSLPLLFWPGCGRNQVAVHCGKCFVNLGCYVKMGRGRNGVVSSWWVYFNGPSVMGGAPRKHDGGVGGKNKPFIIKEVGIILGSRDPCLRGHCSVQP